MKRFSNLILAAVLFFNITGFSWSGPAQAVSGSIIITQENPVLNELISNNFPAPPLMVLQDPIASTATLLSLAETLEIDDAWFIFSPFLLGILVSSLNELSVPSSMAKVSQGDFHIAATDLGASGYFIVAAIAGIVFLGLAILMIVTILWPLMHMWSKPKTPPQDQKKPQERVHQLKDIRSWVALTSVVTRLNLVQGTTALQYRIVSF